MAKPRAAAAKLTDLAAYRRALGARTGGSHAYVTLLGLKTFDTESLLARVSAGFAYTTLERFRRNAHLTAHELADLVQIRPRTLVRRREEGRLSAEESDRLLRASRVCGRALALFEGDADATRAWLATPAPTLGGRTPLEAARTEVGAREVEHLAGRLEHGVFS